MKYLKVWTSFLDVMGPLSDDEKGRLFGMMLKYAENGEEPSEFPGNELFIWPAAKQMIDLAAEKAEKLRENGSKGGFAKSKNRQIVAELSKPWQNVANDSKSQQSVAYKEKKGNEKKGKETESFLTDAEAAEIQGDHDQILDAAQNAGFKGSPAERAGLLNLYAMYGTAKVLSGIQECVTHSAPNLAYLTAVLKGTGKKKDARDPHGYEQRDYSGAQADAIRRMMSDDWGEEGASNG